MASTPETNFKKRVQKYLTEKNIYHVKYFGCMFTQNGVPDILGIAPSGRFLGLELKVKPNKPTPLQERQIKLINKSGGYAQVLYPEQFEEFKKILDNL